MTEIPSYNPADIEPKWQAQWEADGLYHSDIDETKPKYYALTMLPYPSGNLHIGHWYAMTPSDARARWLRMRGYNVLFPMGFDAFGLPAENAAIKDGIHPMVRTYANIEIMRKQLRSMGAMFDWRREAVSCDPEYYRWSQWAFIKLFKSGKAYRKFSPVDWCPNCNTTLAREQVWGEDRHCERCKTPVIKKDLDQWYFRTTEYAEELLHFDGIDWPDKIIAMQTNWIGRSEGASVIFHSEQGDPIEIFTTRPDTLWGATFMVLAPEHPLVAKLTTPEHKTDVDAYIAEATRQTDIERESTEKEKSGVFIGAYAINPVNGAKIPIWIADYVLMTYGTGAIMAVPAHDERDFAFAIKFGLPIIPVIDRNDGVSKSLVFPDSVDEDFGAKLTAAGIEFFTQPVGDLGDGLFVTLQRKQVDDYVTLMRENLQPNNWNEIVGSSWLFVFDDGVMALDSVESDQAILARCKAIYPPVSDNRTTMEMVNNLPFYQDVLFHADYGDMIHSAEFTSTPGSVAKKKVTQWLEQKGYGKGAINYRLRDWLISRQRYWGAPIPIIHCPKCGQVPVPENQLPVMLPEDVEWLPTGQSPLKLHPTWSKTTCPNCGGPAERDTDTMDTFMCSSWYHLRYLSPHYDKGMFDPKEYDYWMPVDTYTGGAEHATMHLIYTRYFHKAFRDIGVLEGHEPMLQLRNQGQILGPDGQRMSKSRGNVIDPDEQVEQYGADAVRAYLMFGYQWSEGGPWSTENITGVVRWLRRTWALFHEASQAGAVTGAPDPTLVRDLRRKVHQTLKRINDYFESFQFNTIISSLMELLNEMYKAQEAGVDASSEWGEAMDIYLRMMAPVMPHIAEELWQVMGKPYSIHTQSWPQVDENALIVDEITLVLQVNGKVRDRLVVPADISQEDARTAALSNETVQKFLNGRQPKKVIVVPGKLVNVVG